MTTVSTVIHETDDHGTFEEFLHLREGARYALLAPHGGQVEPNTDSEAVLATQRLRDDATTWGTRGIVNGSFDAAFGRWHTTSQTDPLTVFPLYQQLTQESFEAACSLHVMSEDGIIVGGRAPEETRQSLCSHLATFFPDADIRLGHEGEPRSGMKRENFVNNLDTPNPIHIEQGVTLALNHPSKLARGLAMWLTSGDWG